MAGYSGGTPVTARPPGGGRGPTPAGPPRPQRPSRPGGFVAGGNGQPRPQNVNRPPAPGQAHPPPATRGHWVPQGDSWVLIHAVGKGKWSPGAVPGAKAPARPSGPTPLPNNPLAPLTQNQIQRSAASTISKAYGPGYTDLNNQTAQAKNLYQTQSADDQAFAEWLGTNQRALNDQIAGVNEKMSGVMQGIQQSQQAQLAALPGQLGSQAEAGGGLSTAPGQMGQALANETAGSTGAANLRTADAAAQGVQQGIIGSVQGMNAGSVAQARLSNQQNTELGNLTKTLTTIAGERAKLNAGQIGDTAKEITRLQGVELSKRQWLRSEADIEQKAGVASQSASTLNQTRIDNATTARINARTHAEAAKETALHNANMEKIATTHYADAQAAAAARQQEIDRHNRVTEGISQQKANTTAGGKGPVKFGSPTQQRAVVNYLDSVRQALMTDIQRFHNGQPNALKLAYHDLQSGRAAAAGIKLPGAPNHANAISYLNAATNTLVDHGAQGLTPGDIAFLNQEGLQVGSRYPRTTDHTGVGAAVSRAGR